MLAKLVKFCTLYGPLILQIFILFATRLLDIATTILLEYCITGKYSKLLMLCIEQNFKMELRFSSFNVTSKLEFFCYKAVAGAIVSFMEMQMLYRPQRKE
jgi:hypothetical protein